MTATSKISPDLKELLDRNGHPPRFHSSEFSQKLTDLFSDFHRTASSNNLTSKSWIIFTTAALVSLNRPSAFEPFWISLTSNNVINSKMDLVHLAKLIRETGLKSVSLAGTARTITALNAFRAVVEKRNPELLASLDQEKPRRLPNCTENSSENITHRAKVIFKSIYTPLDEKLLSKLALAHPDLPIHILNSHYGPLHSDPKSNPGPIGRMSTSLLALGNLQAAGQLGSALLSHVYGLKNAGEELSRRVGEPSLGTVEGTRWLTSNEGVKWVLTSVDRLVELIRSSEISHTPTSKL